MNGETGGKDGPEAEAPGGRRRAITILGAPVEAGASVPGSATGPAMLRTAGIVKTLSELGHDVEDRGDLSPPPSAGPRAFAGRQVASVRPCLGLGAPARARDLRGHAVRADADRARRRPQPGDGLDRRRGAICGRSGARIVRSLARRAFGLQHAADLSFRQHARHVGGDAVPRARLRGRVRRRAARICRARPAASVRHPVDRFRRTAAAARARRRRRRHADARRARLRRLDPPHHRSGSRPRRAACMSVWTWTFSIRRSRRASGPRFPAGRPTARRIW